MDQHSRRSGGCGEGGTVRYWHGPTFQEAGGGGRGGGGLECEVLAWTNIPGGQAEGGGGLECEVLTWTNISGGGAVGGGGGVRSVSY